MINGYKFKSQKLEVKIRRQAYLYPRFITPCDLDQRETNKDFLVIL